MARKENLAKRKIILRALCCCVETLMKNYIHEKKEAS